MVALTIATPKVCNFYVLLSCRHLLLFIVQANLWTISCTISPKLWIETAAVELSTKAWAASNLEIFCRASCQGLLGDLHVERVQDDFAGLCQRCPRIYQRRKWKNKLKILEISAMLVDSSKGTFRLHRQQPENHLALVRITRVMSAIEAGLWT